MYPGPGQGLCNYAGKVALITDKGAIRIYDPDKTVLVTRLGKPTQVFKSFKSDEHKLVYAFKLDTSEESNIVRLLTNMKEIKEIKITDYHLTPMDYYCHDSIDLGKKNRLEIPFIEGKDRILAKTVSHLAEAPVKEEPQIIEQIEDIPSKKEEEDFPKKGYVQISIFDDDDEDDEN